MGTAKAMTSTSKIRILPHAGRLICGRQKIAMAGSARMIDESYVQEGAVVIDVGINVDENGHLCGDVDFEDIREQASMATPVPGGIGSVTTAVLAKRLVNAALAQARAERETNAGL